MPPSETESADDFVEQQDVAGHSGQGMSQPPQKKRYRPSKKDITDYPFTDEQKREIAEFVKQHPSLYDKRDKQWRNPKLKETLWRELAETFPDCAFLQVRKFFETKRTDFGKIEKREAKSGAPARQRTTREEEVMNTWGFLGGHIAHETQPSDRFSSISQRTAVSYDEDSSSDLSGLYAASIKRRRKLKQRNRSVEEVQCTCPTVQTVAGHAIKELLHKVNLLTEKKETRGPEAEIQIFSEYMCSRLRNVPRVHYKLLFRKILDLITSLEELPEEHTSIDNATQIIESVQMTSQNSATSQPPATSQPSQWQQPPPVQAVAMGPPQPFQQHQFQQQQFQQQQFQQQPIQGQALCTAQQQVALISRQQQLPWKEVHNEYFPNPPPAPVTITSPPKTLPPFPLSLDMLISISRPFTVTPKSPSQEQESHQE